ncbi:Dbl homology domain-containing protein [Syncephalastrum racemosum]|uniref:Dbl homology domain-containing protein n=1 Tax=Syncephalastrum racemosum TaxID=13706 RepID=A0A1X2H753_SYNRA|nr:Dbl homology domain-containing protein [Syncephalastrum racemosum]
MQTDDWPVRPVSNASSQTTSRGSQTSSSIRHASDATNLTSFSLDYVNNPPPPPPNDHPNASHYQLDIIDDLDFDDVDDGLIDHEMGHRHREALVQELHSSEQAYLQSLEDLSRIFEKPLRKDAKSSKLSFLGMKKMVCTEREIRWLFCNMDDILQVHQSNLASLNERLRIWGPTQIISDIFMAWLPKLSVYTTYLDNYSVAVSTYERLTRYQPFKKFIDTAHKEPALQGATLLSLLQVPAGCITRYAHLITKLAEATSPMHPDYHGLGQCRQRIQQLAEDLRPRVEDVDNVNQVMAIQEALVGAPFGAKAQRRLVLQGSISRGGVVKQDQTTPLNEDRIYILFSDMLVIVRPKQEGTGRTVLQYKDAIPLERARIRRLSEPENCIEITSALQGVDTLNTTFVGSSNVHLMYTSSSEEQETWYTHLTAVVRRLDRALAASKSAAQNRRNARHPESVRRQATQMSGSSRESSNGSSAKSSLQ